MKILRKRNTEKYYPFIIAMIIAVLVFESNLNLSNIKNFKDILASIVKISAILIGFLATMISVLIATAGRRVMKRIRDNNATEMLKSYFFCTLTSGFVAAVYSTLLNVFIEVDGLWSKWMLVAWTFIVVLFLVSAYRILNIMLEVLKSVLIEYEETQETNRIVPESSKAFANRKKK